MLIPLYGDLPLDWTSWITSLLTERFLVVLVENNVEAHADCPGPQIQPNQHSAQPQRLTMGLVHKNQSIQPWWQIVALLIVRTPMRLAPQGIYAYFTRKP